MAVHNPPSDIVMSTGEMVDAALVGLDLGEFATIPSLPCIADWDAFEAARQKLLPNLSRARPAARYREQPNTQRPTSSQGGNSGKRLQQRMRKPVARRIGFRTKPEDVRRS